jgi:hypothetical protein
VEYWRERTGHTRAKASRGRIAKVTARLRDGFTEAQLRLAIDGCTASEFHSGANDGGRAYDELTLIMRSTEKVEQFIELAGGDAMPEEDERAALRERAAAAMKRRDRVEYERVQQRLREIDRDEVRGSGGQGSESA